MHIINSVTKLDLLKKKSAVQPGGCSGLKAVGISQLMRVLIPVLAALILLTCHFLIFFIVVWRF